jgi:hypothetical protein
VTDTIGQNADGASVERRRHPSRRRRVSAVIVLALAVSAGIGAAVADCKPTGTPVVDPLYSALFAVFVTYVCSRASRDTLLVLSVVALVMSRSWLDIPAGAAVLIAFGSLFLKHSRRRVGALIGALSGETLLRWPSIGFHGSTAAVAGAALVPLLVSAYRRLSTPERRRAKRVLALTGVLVFVLSVPVALASVLAKTEISGGQRAAEAAFGDVSSGSAAPATRRLRTATAEFSDASSELGNWLTSVAKLVPIVAQERQALAAGATTAHELVAVAAREAPTFDYRQLSYHKGQVDLRRVSAMLGPARVLDTSLSTARARLAGLENPWLVGPIQSRLRDFAADLDRAKSSTDLAVKAIPLVPDMLGAQRPQHYFLAFVSPSESRGLDGIVAAYGELTAVNGHISLTVSGPVESLDSALPSGGGRLTGLPDFTHRYGQFDPGEHFQDTTYSPDFPTVAQVISQLYPQAGGDQLDGVLMVDPYGLAPLLSITGPVSVPGLTQALTSHNAAGILLKSQYLNGLAQDTRHDLLQFALHATFQKLVNGSLPGPQVLSRDLEPAVLGGRIAFWSAHPNDAPLVQALHLADTFPKTQGGDLLAVTTQNVGANKIDAYLHTSIADHVTFDPGTGTERSVLQVTLTNDAPATGLPPLVIDSPAVPKLAPGTNETWLSVYSPLAFDKVTVDGVPSTMSTTRELGVWAYSSYVDVPSRSSVTVQLDLLGRFESGTALRLSVRLQPSANPERVRAVVRPVGPWNLAPTSGSTDWNLGAAVRQSRVYRFVAK